MSTLIYENGDHRVGTMGFSEDNLIGFVLALISSAFIGASFIIKKKGLRRAAAASGVRAGTLYLFLADFQNSRVLILVCDLCIFLELLGVGGYSYLMEPLWWLGLITSEWIFLPVFFVYRINVFCCYSFMGMKLLVTVVCFLLWRAICSVLGEFWGLILWLYSGTDPGFRSSERKFSLSKGGKILKCQQGEITKFYDFKV